MTQRIEAGRCKVCRRYRHATMQPDGSVVTAASWSYWFKPKHMCADCERWVRRAPVHAVE